MKRRTFVRNTTLTGLGIGMVGLNACSSPTKKNKEAEQEISKMPFFKLALAQWSIHGMIGDGLDPYEFAAKAKKWGFEGLEYVSQLYKEDLMKSGSIMTNLTNITKKLNQRSQDNGMKNLVMMVDLEPENGDLAVMDESKRLKAIENHYPYIDATAALGCHSMRINMFGSLDPAEWKSSAVDALGALGTYAAKSNVNIVIENHGYLTSNAKLLMDVINEVNMENCGTLPDFGNFCLKRADNNRWGGECMEEYDMYKGIKELMPRAKSVSAKSYDFDEEGDETTIDFRKMLQIIKDAGYTEYISVEYEGSRLSEEEGILATKELLIKYGSEM